MNKKFAASELILNSDGSIYHCNLRPENLGDTIFLVGDPDRVPVVSSFFDSIDFTTQHREIVTHTGTIRGKKVSAISTGMGTDNIDIVLNELDALASIDFEKKELLSHPKQLTFIRLGTSGALQEEIPVDSFLASSHCLGFDGLLHYYDNTTNFSENEFVKSFINQTNWNAKLPMPYLVEGNAELVAKAKINGFLSGVTATASGFYGPQGRILRLGISDENLNEKLTNFRFDGFKITNFEMETSAIYGLAKLMNHRALTINCIIANRITGDFSKDAKSSIKKLIQKVIEIYI